MKHISSVSAGIAVCAILAVATLNFAQNPQEPKNSAHGAPAWTGTSEDALFATRSGTTIPLSTYSISPTKVKEKKALTGTIVGGNPFSNPPTGSTINAVVVPIIFDIGGTIFDPTAANSCDGNYSAVNRFNFSPLVQPVPNLTFNGVNVGTVQIPTVSCEPNSGMPPRAIRPTRIRSVFRPPLPLRSLRARTELPPGPAAP